MAAENPHLEKGLCGNPGVWAVEISPVMNQEQWKRATLRINDMDHPFARYGEGEEIHSYGALAYVGITPMARDIRVWF